MTELTYEQLKEIVSIASEKGLFDIVTVAAPSVVALFAVWVSYLTVKRHSVHVTNEKVIEKDVEKLYEAADCFFEYSDAVGLFFSMQEKRFRRVIALDPDDEGFAHKVNEATGAVYSNFSKIHKTSFLLKALGQKEVADLVDAYRSQSIILRKSVYELSQAPSEEAIKSFLVNIAAERSNLEAMKNECLEEIAACKGRIKGSVG
ncbi:hypothetical protein [Neptunomonas japonica]|uniref:Uncharacterized protein n=1 Tax=Neptunomonas japonica JAMM 1380 TaxID=1441457 RepID=A0A7R6SXF5_9GAMM|nr:hypothetical protein [Neptunomonas japonica]BBB31495.1 conserved hypothetical protein [Neptunomonas japonica JAMM 1380]